MLMSIAARLGFMKSVNNIVIFTPFLWNGMYTVSSSICPANRLPASQSTLPPACLLTLPARRHVQQTNG